MTLDQAFMEVQQAFNQRDAKLDNVVQTIQSAIQERDDKLELAIEQITERFKVVETYCVMQQQIIEDFVTRDLAVSMTSKDPIVREMAERINKERLEQAS